MHAHVSYDEAASAWILQTDDQTLADAVHYNEGWGRTNMGGELPIGAWAVYTREPHAALNWFKATPEGSVARNRLLPYRDAYLESLAIEHDWQPPVPGNLPDWLEPMAFQRAGVHRCVDLVHAILGDDMGTGKTAQGIMVANTIGAERVLCGVPANARSQWVEAIKVWSTIPHIYRKVYPIFKSADGVNPFAAWTVVSYDLMRSPGIYRALLKQDFDLFIGDEAHMLKTVDSARSQAALGSLDGSVEGLAQRAKKTLLMTGTPLPNRPRECYNLVRHTCWDAIDWLSEDAFQERYNPSRELYTGHVLEEHSRGPELRARLRCNVMTRRKKRAVLAQLPPERHEIIHLDPDGAIKQALKAEKLIDVDLEHFTEMGFQAQGQIATVRRLMGIAKTARLNEHVVGLMEGGLPKLFVACFHREVMDILAAKWESFGVVQIRGGQTARQRDVAKLTFIRDPSFGILIGQFEAAGQALDGLQEVCSQGLFAEVSWVHKDNVQVSDRLIRNGQRSGVLWQYAVAPGSIDEMILGKSISKGQIVEEVLDG